jgi:hypothetical protein
MRMWMENLKSKLAGLVCAGAVLITASANAAIVPLGTSGWQAEWPDALDPFLGIVVDGQTTNQLFIQKTAQFTNPFVSGETTPIDIVFRQVAASTITQIGMISEVLTNQTGSPWVGFRMELLNNASVAFDPAATNASGGPAPIGWNLDPFTTGVFSGGNQVLTIGGGSIANNDTYFPGTGPGGGGTLYINVNSAPSAPFSSFTLRERPVVPEPAGLAVIGGMALLIQRRRAPRR